jgi:hypothetical protein
MLPETRLPVAPTRHGANTRVCRVETHLDALPGFAPRANRGPSPSRHIATTLPKMLAERRALERSVAL